MTSPTTTPRRVGARLLLVLLAWCTVVVLPGQALADSHRENGWTTSAKAPQGVRRGRMIALSVDVRSATTRAGQVRVEIVHVASGRRTFRATWPSPTIVQGRTSTFPVRWHVPTDALMGTHRVKVLVSRPNGGTLQHVNDRAEQFGVGGLKFLTIGPGRTLPSDAVCARHVRQTGEIRPGNSTANNTRGQRNASLPWPYSRVTGNFTGTTDELIQWAACKWGFHEDVVRAQTAKESWWFQRALGDWTSDSSRCAPGHPIGADGTPGQCPESVGVQQIRWPYIPNAFPWAGTSTAHNLDYAMAARRSCFEGRETWLNTVERGREYRAGDLWGCVGMWFSGRWYTQPAVDYIGAVQEYLADRIWTTASFRNAT